MRPVSSALRVAWPLCYSIHDPGDVAEIGKGGHARRAAIEEDDRLFADWAGVRKCETTSLGYKNCCPGETKLASKWSTSKQGRRRPDFTSPLRQIQTYCGRKWNVRYGYIITTGELVVVRVAREPVGPGLATSRTVRDIAQRASTEPSHSRTFSDETVSSGLQAMSLDTGSSYIDDENPNIEYRPLMFKSIPWDAAGKDKLTINLALWWLHMLTKDDISVQDAYPPLNNRIDARLVQPLSGAPRESFLSIQNPKKPRDKGKGVKKTG